MQILFEPKYNIGDVVALKINSEDEMVIDGFNLRQVSEAGEVILFIICITVRVQHSITQTLI